ncbi:MAG: NADH-quinone oxidoreductase subunit NuoE [Nitrospiraceae bacterium]|jgi:NADH-quinone oxidoreductase E subunit|nr:NADH-quinone oxidoreductase subunit NuoE [Nitrospirota bacterium]MDA8338572.1 NADH-quinone oxidoreductase subunit NuoE [Nitrospiraceae bacterium]
MLNERVVIEINRIKSKYHDAQSSLLPALYVVQREYGWLSPDAVAAVGDVLNVPRTTVKGVATFYSMFRHKPMGRHLIQLCTNVACMIMGAERLVDILKTRYGLEPNSTMDDGRFSLVVMECIGACATAPAMLVDTDFYDNLTEERIVDILENYK